jgi:uncharacterized protein
MKLFIGPVLISILALVAVFLWGGLSALLLAGLLSILEVTLSFDNAVVNAKVLKRMDATWQRRFLTWGILLAVFGTRLVLPVFIVSIAALISPVEAVRLALQDPEAYGRALSVASPLIASFGGAFLLMVSLKYFFDAGKDVHWIASIERHLARWGRIEAIELALALVAVLALSYYAHAPQGPVLAAGVIGIVLFILIQGIANTFSDGAEGEGTHEMGTTVAATGAALFVYLNILDAAFSLDGVIGAFALTTAVPITVYLVQKGTLDTLVYLEHGAHWAIMGLSLSMLASLIAHIPEVVTGLVGLFFVTLAYISSIREQRKKQTQQKAPGRGLFVMQSRTSAV